MRLMAAVVIMAFFAVSCAGVQRNWTFGEKALGVVAVTGCLADNYTTKKGMDAGGYEETNIVLGEDPSDASLGLWTVGLLTGGLLLAHFVPEYRPWILAAWAALGWYGAWHNYDLLKDNGDW
jgi:hypothetical protein